MPAFRKPKYLQHTSAGMINNLLLLITLSLLPFRSVRAPQLVALFPRVENKHNFQQSAERKLYCQFAARFTHFRQSQRKNQFQLHKKKIPVPPSMHRTPSGQNTAHNSANYILHATLSPAASAAIFWLFSLVHPERSLFSLVSMFHDDIRHRKFPIVPN